MPAAVRDRANLLILGYPNNPTGAVVENDLFERLVAYGVPVCHDNAYSEITFDGYVAPSFLATPGAREAGIELLSLSKAFSLPGWRIAFAVGNAAMVGNLLRLKTNVDAGMFTALQHAAIALLDSDPAERARRWPPPTAGAATWSATRSPRPGSRSTRPRGGMYVWLPVPGGEGSLAFSERILDACDVVVSPGVAYGPVRRGIRAARADPARGPAGRGRASG